MQLYYHMYGSDLGELNIYQRRGLRTDDRIWGVRGEQGDVWHEALIDISGNCYQVGFSKGVFRVLQRFGHL